MAKRNLGIPLLLTAAAAVAGTGYGVLQDVGVAKIAQLEQRVKLLDDRLAKIEKYVGAQASSIAMFGVSLDAAVKKGFTAGINYESRQILVEGWRRIIDSVAKNTLGLTTQPDIRGKSSASKRSR